MGHRRDFLPTKLSGGEQQRVAIARALLGAAAAAALRRAHRQPRLRNTASVLALFDGLASQGLTLIVITHDEDVARHAKRVVRIVDGLPHGGDRDEASLDSRRDPQAAPEAASRPPAASPATASSQPHMELRDLVTEAAAGLMARPRAWDSPCSAP